MSCLHKAASYPSLALICEILSDRYVNPLVFDSRLHTPSQVVPHNYLSSHKITFKSERQRFLMKVRTPVHADEMDEMPEWNPQLHEEGANLTEVPHLVLDGSEHNEVSYTNTNRSQYVSDRGDPSFQYDKKSDYSNLSRRPSASCGLNNRDPLRSQNSDLGTPSSHLRPSSLPKKLKFNKFITGPSSFCDYNNGSKQKRFIRDILHLPTNMLKDLKKEIGQSPMSLNLQNFSSKNVRSGTEWNQKSDFSLEPTLKLRSPADLPSQKTFLNKNYSHNVGRLIKADSGLLEYMDADGRNNLSEQNTSMRRLGVNVYPPGYGADSGSRNQDTPDSSRGIGDIEDSRTIDRPSISTRPLTKTLGLFRPSINEVRALMMYPTPHSRAERDGITPTQMQDNEDKQLIVRNRILANLIKGAEAVKKANLTEKQQLLGVSNKELGRLSKSGLGSPITAGHLTPPNIEIQEPGLNNKASALFFTIPQSKSSKLGFDLKLFEQAIIKVSAILA